MLARTLLHLTGASIVIAVALILGLPFFLTLAVLFFGR
jgi:hypothetical protein